MTQFIGPSGCKRFAMADTPVPRSAIMFFASGSRSPFSAPDVSKSPSTCRSAFVAAASAMVNVRKVCCTAFKVAKSGFEFIGLLRLVLGALVFSSVAGFKCRAHTGRWVLPSSSVARHALHGTGLGRFYFHQGALLS